MDSCGPFLATHFLLEKQVEAAGANHYVASKCELEQIPVEFTYNLRA
jgi:hypothetical protein